MVTNRNRRSFGSGRKNSKICSDDWTFDVFDLRSGISGLTSRRASACANFHEWWTQPAHVRCPVAQLLIKPKSGVLPCLARELGRNLRCGHCFGSSGTKRISGGKTRSNWATQFLTVAYISACSRNDLSEWHEFSSTPCLAGKKTLWQLTSRCWNGACRQTCFLSASVTRKYLHIAHEQTLLSDDTINSVLRHWELDRAKDLSAPPRILIHGELFVEKPRAVDCVKGKLLNCVLIITVFFALPNYC
jgi:hypothetical protein